MDTTPQNQPLQIIGNESNNVIEIESSTDTHGANNHKASDPVPENKLNTDAARSNDEVATNDGAVIETLDTAFHNKPGMTEGETGSGSNRADYYEAQSYGKTDSEEELDALNGNQLQ